MSDSTPTQDVLEPVTEVTPESEPATAPVAKKTRSKKATPAPETETPVTPAPETNIPVSPLQSLQGLFAEQLPEVKTEIKEVGERPTLVIGPDLHVAVDCIVIDRDGKLVASCYGFIKPESRARIMKVLAQVGISATSVFLHRNGR